MANEAALQGQSSHLANGSRGRSQLLPYQPYGFTIAFQLDMDLLGMESFWGSTHYAAASTGERIFRSKWGRDIIFYKSSKSLAAHCYHLVVWETDFYTPRMLGGAALFDNSAPAVCKNPVP